MIIINFLNKDFKVRQIEMPELGNILISTNSLNNLLMTASGNYTSDDAIKIDEKIYYFVEDEEISLPLNELSNILLNR